MPSMESMLAMMALRMISPPMVGPTFSPPPSDLNCANGKREFITDGHIDQNAEHGKHAGDDGAPHDFAADGWPHLLDANFRSQLRQRQTRIHNGWPHRSKCRAWKACWR